MPLRELKTAHVLHCSKGFRYSLDRLAGVILSRQILHRAGIFKQSMGARNRVDIGLSYRPARLHRLAEFVPRNRFLRSINV
jgi:hypothetical protein